MNAALDLSYSVGFLQVYYYVTINIIILVRLLNVFKYGTMQRRYNEMPLILL